MSKFVGIIVGGIEIAAGVALTIFTGGALAVLGASLITAGVGMLLSGVGTLIAGSGGGNPAGQAVASRNPVAPWLVVYGRTVVGGTVVHLREFGDSNKYLDMVIVLACHPCNSVDGLLFDKQLVQLSTAGGTFTGIGDSFTPVQQTVTIVHISRTKGVVTCIMAAAIPLLTPGDRLIIEGVSGDYTLNGRYPVGSVSTDRKTFTYICGGANAIVDNEGVVKTAWPDYGRKVHMEVLLGTHTATFPGMVYGTANDGDTGNLIYDSANPWTADHKLLGRTAVFLRLHYDDTVFAGGLPTISFLVSGKNDIYDPRTGTYGYSENAALCTADYLAHPTWGFKAAYGTEIPSTPLIAAANICDEAVALATGGTEPRYTINGKFDLSVKRGEVLQNLLTACAGKLTYSAGQFTIWPAAWRGSSPAPAPGLGGMAGPFRWRPTVSIRDLYNGVKGTYLSPANNWQASDIPPYAQDALHGYSSDANLAADGGDRRWLDIQLPFTISAAAAQRICKIELLRRRHQGTGTFRFSMAGYGITPMDVLSMNMPLFSWSGKLLEVLAHRFTLDKVNQDGNEVTLLGTEIDVQETDASVYDWSDSEELTPQGYQQPFIPDARTPAPPSGLTLLSNTSTAVVTPQGLAPAILVTWTQPVDGYVLNGGHIEVQYQQVAANGGGTVSATNGSAAIAGSGTAWTSDMEGGTLTVNGVSTTILSVADATHLTLASNFTGPTGSGLHFYLTYAAVWIGLPSVNASVTRLPITGVLDGAQYNVQIRSVNAGGVPSAWVLAGPITAQGAAVPLPLKPYAERYPFAPHGYGFGLAQIQGPTGKQSIAISGTLPVNTLSPTLAAPVIDPYAVVTAHTGNALLVGSWIAQVFAVDSNGLYGPGSNFTQFTVTSGTQRVTFTATFPPGAVSYEIFIGRDADNLIGQGIQGVGAPSLNVDTFTIFGYGPPDAKAVGFHATGRRVTHAGIAIATVVSSASTSIVIGIPSAAAADEFAGRYLIVASKAGLPATGSYSVIPIDHSDTGFPNCTLTVLTPLGLAVDPGDLVLIATKSSAVTLTSIEDTGFVSPFAPTGLTASAEIGLMAMVLFDPTGSALPGDQVKILDNTATAYTTTPWPRTPGNNTVFIIVEPALRADVHTVEQPNAIAPIIGTTGTTPLVSIPSADLQGYVALVQLRAEDANGNESDEAGDGLRLMYIVPAPNSQNAGPVNTIAPNLDGSYTPDLTWEFQRIVLTANAVLQPPINTPTGGSRSWTLIVDFDPGNPANGPWSLIPDATAYFCGFAVTGPSNTRAQITWTNDEHDHNSAQTSSFNNPIPA